MPYIGIQSSDRRFKNQGCGDSIISALHKHEISRLQVNTNCTACIVKVVVVAESCKNRVVALPCQLLESYKQTNQEQGNLVGRVREYGPTVFE